jgi:hypothetical protein
MDGRKGKSDKKKLFLKEEESEKRPRQNILVEPRGSNTRPRQYPRTFFHTHTHTQEEEDH